MTLIKQEDAVKTVIRMCSPICAWQVGTQQYPDCVGAEINALPSAELTLQTPQTYGKSINPSNAEVVEDYISRADAIEAVLTYFIPRSHTGERGEHEEDFVRTIFKALPSAEAEWIPCSERLPKKGEVVLITNGKGNVRCGQYRSEHDVRDGTHYWWWKGKTVESVLAWMPLPKPYREDGEEE